MLREQNESFVEKLETELRKVDKIIKEEEVVEHVLSNIRMHLLDKKGEYVANQNIIGWKYAFRGYAVKTWIRDAHINERYMNINRNIVKLLVTYYVECWKS